MRRPLEYPKGSKGLTLKILVQLICLSSNRFLWTRIYRWIKEIKGSKELMFGRKPQLALVLMPTSKLSNCIKWVPSKYKLSHSPLLEHSIDFQRSELKCETKITIWVWIHLSILLCKKNVISNVKLNPENIILSQIKEFLLTEAVTAKAIKFK